jgi:hypothetical protein
VSSLLAYPVPAVILNLQNLDLVPTSDDPLRLTADTGNTSRLLTWPAQPIRLAGLV